MQYSSKRDFIILLGNVIDHFDTSIYLFLAPIMAPLFFPHSDPVVALIMAYGILATSIIARPVGTYIFGMITNNSGPSKALSYSLIGVGIATLVVSILPDYHTIGIAAPTLLIILRIFREIFAAGESAIAKLYILQDKPEKEAFKSSYLYPTSTILGIMLASFASTFVYYLDIANSWRIVFFLGGFAAVIGYILRNNTAEVPKKVSKKLFKSYGHDGIKILWNHKVDLLRIAVVNSFSHLTYIIPFVTMNHLIPLITEIELKTMMAINSFMLVFDMVAIPSIGRIINHFKPRDIMIISSITLALTIIPMWYFIADASLAYITFVRFWIVIWGIVFLCPLNLWCNNQIKGNKKYIVVGMGTTLGASVIGKLTPSICLALYYSTETYISIAIYIAIMFVIVTFTIKN